MIQTPDSDIVWPVAPTDMNLALDAVSRGEDQANFYHSARKCLTSAPKYASVLDSARAVDFDPGAVEAGIIAGLKIASRLANINFEFVGGAE